MKGFFFLSRPAAFWIGVDLAKQLGGTLVTFDGTQHTAVFEGGDFAAWRHQVSYRTDRAAARYPMLCKLYRPLHHAGTR
jgi:hypothetical protein